ncbi:MAG: tRNA (adenosine(37)-N6)-dimethylallyltransferase MiaA [Bacteroidetes bacterium]|nr:tRNA (adenosine(37)-N6)-dimethylallyltransferase MiaA [Bacteroidota bacterium]
MHNNLLVVIAGPTASGKTAAAIELALHYGTEIISADSRQFYREIPIGTATPNETERRGVVHHWLGNRSITEPVDAGTYSREVRALLAQLFARQRVVILTGGSGLYIDAVLNGFDELPEADETVRNQLRQEFENHGITALQQKLNALDPVYFAQVDVNNPARLIRAIEVCLTTGKPYSALRRNNADQLPWPYLKFGMDLPRETLYERVNQRTLKMLEEGFEAEAGSMLPYRHEQALQTVGYKEWFEYFDGKISREEAVLLIQQHTRNYAKRQLTWNRRDTEMISISPNDVTGMIAIIDQKLNS